jgi:carboxylesterase type B
MAVSMVQTRCGLLKGEETPEGIRRFLGVRFAEARRFEKPRPVMAWNGVLEALKFGNACPQFRTYHDDAALLPFYYHEFREGLTFTYSEDCLYLNIYAPKEAKKAPVILYFFGGSFTRGSNDEKPVDGTLYAKKGILFVAGSYRLNAFGKLLYKKSPQNLPLYDMIAALDWLQNNIEAFGGDPDNITVMGQSAGAISLQALLFNPGFRKRVKGAILLSGGGFRKGLFAPHSSFWIKRFSAHVHGDLETMDAQTLFEAFNKEEKKNKLSPIALLPSYDGELIRKSDHKTIPNDMPPLIIGTVKNEVLGPKRLPEQARKYQAESPTPVYLYRFLHDLPSGSQTNFHSCDLWYAMGSLSRSWRGTTEADDALIERMTNYFAAFAKAHDPNGANQARWEKKGEMIFE